MNDYKVDEYITDSVPTAVWLATLVLSYSAYNCNENEVIWMKQRSIQDLASKFCSKNIDNARISQWCNGDHPNNTYNYLRAFRALRRVTKQNEYNGIRELPDIIPTGKIIIDEAEFNISEILEWYYIFYSVLDIEEKIERKPTEPIKLQSVVERNSNFVEVLSLENRVELCIKQAWETIANKINGGIVSVNREASLQLHFANILQQIIPLYIYDRSESVSIELETGVRIDGKSRNIDVLIKVFDGDMNYKIAIEMKCYREYAASGGKRGALDIFMKDVYFDLHLIEKYQEYNIANKGIVLIMTDFKNVVFPRKKSGKFWRYDISEGAIAQNELYNIPIGGKDICFELSNQHCFNWKNYGGYFFTYLENLQNV